MKPQSVGLCGEHYVAALLAGHGLAVAVPRGGAARDDLFIAESELGRPVRLQVKTARDPFGNWKGKDFCSWDCRYLETSIAGRWYAFVALRGWPVGADLPHVYFVPSSYVAERMVDQKDKKRSFFWMYTEDATRYLNIAGVNLLINDLKDGSAPKSIGP